jgi:hypothetical protein
MSSTIRERRGVVQSLVNALATKPFVLLAGISGSGKTQMARRIASGLAAGVVEGGLYTGKVLGGQVSGPSFRRMLADNGVVPDLEGADGDAFVDINALRLPGSYADNEDADVVRNLRKLMRDRVAFLPVRPDWSDSRKLWGYYNPLTGLYYPTDALRVTLHAYLEYIHYGERAPRHFIILDELNLARVEYYLSDILSLMECPCEHDGKVFRLGEMATVHPFHRPLWTQSAPQIQLGTETSTHEQTFIGRLEVGWARAYNYLSLGATGSPLSRIDIDFEEVISGADWDRLVPPRVSLPPNLSIIGTVNVDETTFSFAPKVLDRAFVLEFNDVEYAEVCADWPHFHDIQPHLEVLHDLLRPANLHFGYRVVHEITSYLASTQGGWEVQGDFLMMSKILPKLRGGEDRLGALLPPLLAYAVTGALDLPLLHEVAAELVLDLQDGTPLSSSLARLGVAAPAYPLATDKLLRMTRQMLETGLASYF